MPAETAPAPKSFQEKISSKFRHGLVLKWCSDRLSEVGIGFMPFYLVREGTFGQPSPFNPDEYRDFDEVWLGPDDAEEMNRISGRDYADLIRQRFATGMLCLGLRHEGRIVAFTWASLHDHTNEWPRLTIPIGPDEALLLDAYTDKAFRGRQLLPYLRDRHYRELEPRGRSRFYSISELVNGPSIRFKQRLGARRVAFGIGFALFNRCRTSIILRRYPEDTPL